MDEIEHDSENYEARGLRYLPKPKAEADNTNRGLNNSRYHAKTEFNNCFIIQLYNYKCKSHYEVFEVRHAMTRFSVNNFITPIFPDMTC